MKKIIIIPSLFAANGSEFIIDQAKVLQKNGFDVTIIANNELKLIADRNKYFRPTTDHLKDQIDNITIHQSTIRAIPFFDFWNMDRWTNATLKLVERHIAENGIPDAIHAYSAHWAGYVAFMLKRRHGIPYVITEHIPVIQFEEQLTSLWGEKWPLPIFKRAYENADKVVVLSPDWVKRARPLFGTKYKWEYISNLVDTDFFQSKHTPSTEPPFIFFCPSIFADRKGFDILLPAFDWVCKAHPNTELWIAGKHFNHARFVNLLSHVQSRNKIRIFPYLDREGVRALYDKSHAMVLATRGESQLMIALESAAMGRPFVVTQGVPSTMQNFPHCYYAPINSENQMAKEMIRMIRNYNTIKPDELRNYVLTMASPSVIGDKLKKLFDKIIYTH